MKICPWQVIKACITENIFMFPKGITATAADPWKDQAQKIICPHVA
jgi:hypothetical protein